MAPTQYQATIRFFSTLMLLGFSAAALACGWGFTSETIRLAFFRAEVPGMNKFRWFYYTSESFFSGNPDAHLDWHRNCNEWRAKLGSNVTEADVFEIQYKTEPAIFELAYKNKSLQSAFPGNSFIKALLQPNNKPLLEYMAFAKKMEHSQLVTDSGWESWEYGKEKPYPDEPKVEDFLKKQLALTTDAFLKQRYAFMLVRFGNKANIPQLYDTYFGNSKSVLQLWALFFKAKATTDKALQNYYLSLVFDQSDDKLFDIMQNFNRAEMRESLKYVKSDRERAVLISMYAMRNPGPALNELREVYALAPDSPYVNLLIAREINKLEDWVLSPKINNDTPSVSSTGEYVWDDKVRDENLINDKRYLKQFRQWLTETYSIVSAGQKDFVAGALAHLCYMEDDVVAGKRFASQISAHANPSVIAQKQLELSLIALKEQGIQSVAAQEQLTDAIETICKLGETDRTMLKGAYTMLRILSKVYEQGGDIATAGLLYRQSENYALMNSIGHDYEMEYEFFERKPGDVYYFYIKYFDDKATVTDMDRLLGIIDKKDKNRFEEFICRGTLTDRNMYLDLKGTIAFRADKLQLAYEVFSKITADFHKKKYEFAYYLNEDPYFPRVLLYKMNKKEGYYTYSQTNYDFNKARFVKELIDLKKKTDVGSYMKLAHAYFNVSQYGNAWMMNSYSRGWGNYGVITKSADDNGDNNYSNLKLSIYYYKKVLESSKDKEQLALASLMLHKCHYLMADAAYDEYNPSFLEIYKADNPLRDFYTKYKDTKVFKTYNCPMLQSFLR